MDYKVKIKERLGKLLFLEMNKDGFKENIGIPSYVTFKNKDLLDKIILYTEELSPTGTRKSRGPRASAFTI